MATGKPKFQLLELVYRLDTNTTLSLAFEINFRSFAINVLHSHLYIILLIGLKSSFLLFKRCVLYEMVCLLFGLYQLPKARLNLADEMSFLYNLKPKMLLQNLVVIYH